MKFRNALMVLAATLVSSAAFAQEAAATEGKPGAMAAGLAIAIAAFGGAIGQGWTASTALDGIARNPNASGKIFVPMIIGLALIESLVLYAFVIAFVKT